MKNHVLKYVFILVLIFNTALTISLLLFSGIIRTLTDMYLPLGALLVLPIFIFGVYAFEIVLITIAIFMISNPRVRGLSTVVLFAVIGMIIIIPCTKSYGTLNFRSYRDHRMKFIEAIGDVNECYPQIDVKTYFVNDIRISYSGSVIVHSEDSETVVIFDVYNSLTGNKHLIYSSVPQDLSVINLGAGRMSNLYFKDIYKINDNWYYATYDSKRVCYE